METVGKAYTREPCLNTPEGSRCRTPIGRLFQTRACLTSSVGNRAIVASYSYHTGTKSSLGVSHFLKQRPCKTEALKVQG